MGTLKGRRSYTEMSGRSLLFRGHCACWNHLRVNNDPCFFLQPDRSNNSPVSLALDTEVVKAAAAAAAAGDHFPHHFPLCAS